MKKKGKAKQRLCRCPLRNNQRGKKEIKTATEVGEQHFIYEYYAAASLFASHSACV